jgi:hypothetical protein
MAARLRSRHQDEIREKIRASQLVNRLTDCALGDVELTAQQLKAIEILLRKSLPDLSAVSIEGSGDNGEIPITLIERRIVRVNASD